MSDSLWDEIYYQPENLQFVINHLFGAERSRLKEAAKFLNNDRPILLAGMGSAEYLCYPAEYHLVHSGRMAYTLSAAAAFYDYFPALKKFNILINSRSGETIEIVRLCQKLAENHIPYIALTNEPESTLARHAEHIVFSNSRKDTLVSINIVTAMMAVTLMLAYDVIGELEKFQREFEQLPGLMKKTIQNFSNQAENFADMFQKIQPLYLLYRGASKGSAACSRLVLEEVARRCAIDMDAAAFRQGPIEVVDRDFGALLFLSHGEAGLLNRALARELRYYGGTVLTIGSDSELTNFFPDQPHVGLDHVQVDLLPLLEVVPAQILACKLAERQGYPPGEVRYISRVITSESAS